MNPQPFALGQLLIEFDEGTAVIHGPRDGSEEHQVEPGAEALRAWVREDQFGRYRPLPTATTLRPDWQVRCHAGLPLEEALEVIYPLAWRHTEQFRAGQLRVVSMQEVFDRQSGRYRSAANLPPDARKTAVEVLCAGCVKAPVWNGEPPPPAGIPCPEPCSVMLSLCREAAGWEQATPSPHPVDYSVPWAAFDRPGNEVREAYLAERFGPDDALTLEG